ncbi:MAG: putative thiamine transporter permease protein, partial [Ilumatobacteraceae bacterium]|nr:putative thiamine transporter permease protein [Ilumatobacteraceae bacterium]
GGGGEPDDGGSSTAAWNRLPIWVTAGIAVPVVVLLGVFYLWPLLTLVARAVRGHTIGDTLRAPGLGAVLWFTVWQAVVSTAATIVVGMVPAYVLARYRFAGRRFVLALVTVPFMLPTVVVGAAFLAVLPARWQGTAAAVVVAHVFFNIAVVVRIVGGMWAVIPHDLTGAARTLGASPWQLAVHVVLPLLRPALWAAGLVVFLFTFTSFGVVTLLGGPAHPTIEVEIARRATQLGDIGGAAVLSVLQLLVLGVLVALSTRQQRRAAVAMRGVAPTRRVRTTRERRLVRGTCVVAVVAMGAPLVAMVLRSVDVGGGWSLAAWRQLGGGTGRRGVRLGVDAWASLLVSLRFAVVAAAISAVVGGLAALAITSTRRAGRLLDAGTMLPLGTSAVTIGFGMLITFDVPPFDWRAEWWLIPVGHALVATPFVVRLLVPVLRAIPADQRAAAATLGASPRRAWLAIDVRSTLRPLVAGAAFAAAISLGEFGATTFLTRTGGETLPIVVSRLFGRPGELTRAQGFAVATVLLVVTGVILALVDTRVRGDDR